MVNRGGKRKAAGVEPTIKDEPVEELPATRMPHETIPKKKHCRYNMDGTHIIQLAKELKTSNYKQCIAYIKKHALNPISSKDSIVLLQYCLIDLKTTASSEDVIIFVKQLHFKNLDETQLTMCIQCSYHLVNHLITNDKPQLLIKLEDILLGLLLEDMVTTKQIDYYKSICNCINNFIIKQLKADQVNVTLTQIIKLVLKMSVRHVELIMTRAQYYIKMLLQLHYDRNKIYKLFVEFIETPGVIKLLQLENNFKILITLIGSLTCLQTPQEIGHFIHLVTPVLIFEGEIGVIFKNISIIFNIKKRFPDNIGSVIQNTLETLKLGYMDNKLQPLMLQLCGLLNNLFYSITCGIRKPNYNEWVVNINEDVLQPFLKLSFFLVESLSAVKYTCCCKLKYNMKTSLQPLIFFDLHFKATIRAELFDLSDKFFLDALPIYKYAVKHIKLAAESNCKKFIEMWASTYTSLYYITAKLYNVQHYVLCYDYAIFLLDSIFKLEKSCNVGDRAAMAKTVLGIYAECNFKSGSHEKALAILALAIQLFPDDSDALWVQWLRVTSYSNAGRVTIVDVLKTQGDFIKKFYPNYIKPDDSVFENLLFCELNSYKSNWTSGRPLLEVFIKIDEVGSAVSLAQAFMMIDLKHTIKLDESIMPIITNCIDKIEKYKLADTNEIKMWLGNMYFLNYKYITSALVLQNYNDMSNISELEKGIAKFSINGNDVCDIVPTYNALNMAKHDNIFKYIHLAFKYLSHSIECSKDFLLKYNPLDVILEMAHTYKLHCYKKEYYKTWQLMMKVAQILNDQYHVLYAITFIFEHIDDLKLLKTMQAEGDKIIANIDKAPSVKLILCTYYTNLGYVHLRMGRVDDCKKSYELATEFYDEIKDLKCIDSTIVISRYLLLQEKFYSLPCDYRLERHEDIVINKAETAYKQLMRYQDSSTQLVTAMFEITEHILSMYKWMRMPREMRSFGRDIVIMAQKLVVPFRTARLLLYLTAADILQCRFQDCDVKLQGISDILAMKQHNKKLAKEKSPLKEINQEVKDLKILINGIEDMNYEFTALPRLTATGSPTLYTEKFKLPQFLSDKPNCNCLPCNCIEYKCLLLQKISLEAQLSEYRANMNAAAEYYQGCFTIFNHLNQHQQFASQLSTEELLNVYDNILLNFVKFKIRSNDLKSAKTLNTKLLSKHDKAPNKNYFIYNEILNLQLGLVMQEKGFYNYNTAVDTLEIKQEHIDEIEQAENSKTPENKCTRLNYVKSVSPSLQLPVKTRVKLVPFNLNDDNAHDFQAPKTPVMKFKIYTPSSTKPAKQPSSARKLVRVKLEDDLVDEKLNVRTRKLTERLKSNVKTEVVVTECGMDTVVENKPIQKRVTRSAVSKKGYK